MELKQIEETIIALSAKQGGMAIEAVCRATHYINDLHFDSLDRVELAMLLEETFDLTIADEDATNMQTVGDAIDYVASQLRTGAA